MGFLNAFCALCNQLHTHKSADLVVIIEEPAQSARRDVTNIGSILVLLTLCALYTIYLHNSSSNFLLISPRVTLHDHCCCTLARSLV